MKKVKFLGEDCTVSLQSYTRGGQALQLMCEDGSPMATATVWVEGLENDELAIKDYSENEGMYEVLRDAGIIQPMHRTIRSGWVDIKVTRLV
jgi:hypothetical protein